MLTNVFPTLYLEQVRAWRRKPPTNEVWEKERKGRVDKASKDGPRRRARELRGNLLEGPMCEEMPRAVPCAKGERPGSR